MSVKRFVAADMRRALELVRQEMGPDAVILSSRRIKQGVEILTSLEPQPLPAGPPSNADRSTTGDDVPMGSDGAWRDQIAVEDAVQEHSALRTGFVDGPALPVDQGVADQRGVASGKTDAELAQEMEQAREKMLAAKKAQQELERPLNESQSFAQRLRDSMQQQSPTRREPVVENHPQPEQSELKSAQQEALLRNAERQLQQQQQLGEQMQEQQQQQLNELRSELADMRLLLEDQLNRMTSTPNLNSPVLSGVLRRLLRMGMAESEASRLLRELSRTASVQEAWQECLAVLARSLPVAADDPVMSGGVYAFVGPTGVGKTTTIAKLAARYVLRHGPEKVTLVTTDTYRIAAHEQLKSLGRIMGVQVKVVDDYEDLPSVLRSLKHCPLVLIDTAGFRLGDPMLKAQLAALAGIDGIKTMLVMAANAQMQMLKATLHAHTGAGLYGSVITKLDEAASIGEVFSLLLEHQLKALYVTDGQEIPADLDVAKGTSLVSKAVGLMAGSNQVSGNAPMAAKEQLYF